ncbi:MAG: TonB-dependent receptor [Calditrichaeota bacterium]|nr:MAG: TonB-dependent receptor [Calditrichota bacterium]
MNFNSWYTGQANISYQVTNLIKLKATFNYENKRFKEYDHFWKYNPDGDLKKFQHGFNTTITLDHTLSSTTFYTVKYAYFKKDFKQYVYEDPTDPRYVNPNAAAFAVPAFTFGVGGQKNQHFNRNTQTHIGKFDITSQVSKNHLMKAGFEIRLHRLFYQDFNVIDIDQTDDELFTPGIPSDTSTNFNQYTFKPVEYSFYVQDKMEYEDFIVNIGLRFDYFDSKGRILRDPKDPNIRSPFLPEHQQMSLAEREQIWYDKPSPKLQLSPRVGVAYPITARGVIHFSYGHFLQIPEFRLLYQNPQFNVTRDRKKDNLVGNADLDAQRTVMYEIGLQQQLSDDISIDVTGYYRDIRGWVGTSPLIETYDNSTFYSQYENRDYANVRGVTLMFRKRFANHFSANLDYTFQVAEGNASDPEDAFNDIKNDKEPRKTIIPLNWDRRHVLNGNVYLGFGGNGISVLARLETGLPYTPQPATGVRVGTNVPQGLRENSGRRPTLFTVDLQLYRDIKFKVGNSEFKWTLFAKIYNLLDRRNEQNVYSDTGRATYTITSGAFADPEYIVRPDFYTQPRRVQLGFSWEF